MCLIAPRVAPVLDGVGVAVAVALGVGVAVAPRVGVEVAPGAVAPDDAVALGDEVAPGDAPAFALSDALGVAVGVPAGNCGTVVVLLPQPAAAATSSEKRTQHLPREIERVMTQLPERGNGIDTARGERNGSKGFEPLRTIQGRRLDGI